MELNNRQKDLYEYLLLKYEENRYVTKSEICRDLPLDYPRHLENNNNEGNCSVVFRNISCDIRAINSNENIEHIIVSNHKGFKIAAESEANTYIERRFKRDLKSLKLDWNLRRKIKRDGQVTMDEDSFKTIETFIKNLN